MKKKFLLIFLLFACCGIFFACKTESRVKTLDVPKNLEVESQYISFDEVENASYYIINYDGNTVTVKPSNTGEIVYNASKILTETKTYEIKVKAVGTGSYLDSEYSEIVTYTRRQNLSAPKIELHGELLSWSQIDGAESYTLEVTYPNNSKNYFSYSTNGFDISSVLYDVGAYKFRVKATNGTSESEFSGEIKYEYSKVLNTPYNLRLSYDTTSDSYYLYMLVDKDSYGYVIKIDGSEYELINEDLKNSLVPTEYQNAKEINISKFLKSKNYVGNFSDISLQIKAKASPLDLYQDSDYSDYVSLKTKKTFSAPTLELKTNNGTSELSWNQIDGVENYLVYKNYGYYLTINASQELKIIFSSSDILNDVFTVSCAGKEYVNPSIMSNAVSVQQGTISDSLTLSFSSNELSWTEVESARYFLEIYNKGFYYSINLNANETSFDLSDFSLDKYTVKLHVLVDEKLPKIVLKEINVTKKLEEVSNAQIGDKFSRYNLSFDPVKGAYGYVVKLNNDIIDTIFTTNTINLTPYIIETGTYQIKVQAISSPYDNITNSDWTTLGSIKHSIKLATPTLNIDWVNNSCILKFNEVENADRYRILINYVDLYANGVKYSSEGYDLTSFLTSAQVYTIKVKALAEDGQTSYYDSDFATTTVVKEIQLATINASDMSVVFDENSNTYLLNFPTETYAAEYEIRIVCEREDGTSGEEIFSVTRIPCDISENVKNAGVYRIYVTAKARNLEGYYYKDASESSNPYIYEKSKSTLNNVKNVKIADKSDISSSLLMTWDAVENADKYYVNIYYEAPNGEAIRTIAEETVSTSAIDLNNYIQKEGKYTFRIQAVSNKNLYPSGYVEETYNYLMEVKADFERNKVYFEGEENSHSVSSYSQLKNLVGYYSLYTNVTYFKNGQSGNKYQLKLKLNKELDDIISGANLTDWVSKKMADLNVDGSDEFKKLYSTICYALGEYQYLENIITFEMTNGDNNSYLIFFTSSLNNSKDYELENKTGASYGMKDNLVDDLIKRKDNYVFKLELNAKMDVSTTEQLFNAVQNGFAPNFVGDYTYAERIYKRAKEILRDICVDTMSDYEKTLAIYDYLINNVTYNFTYEKELNSNASLNDTVMLQNGSEVKLGDFRYEFLDGIFDPTKTQSASYSGLSKAFVLLCRLEGIEAIKVDGTKGEGAEAKKYSWNQVLISVKNGEGKSWYNVDISASYNVKRVNSIEYQIPTHKYFLVTNNYIVNNLKVSQPTNVAYNSFSYSANTSFEYSYIESGQYGDELISRSGNLKCGSQDGTNAFITDMVNYAHYRASLNLSSVIEIDMINTTVDLETLCKAITGSYSATSTQIFGSCVIECEIVSREGDNNNPTNGRVIVIYARPNQN